MFTFVVRAHGIHGRQRRDTHAPYRVKRSFRRGRGKRKKESRVIRPGVAEVIYECLKDAIQTFDIFYNRQFDGRLMKCDMNKSQNVSTCY
ncbi:polymerase delta-interacting protein 3-like [Sipha flava]|uniref:Polymerase delta-interacting protein 3-like n=1 Tax=Sipha flava TaxID=143950 RepID=A0A8B8GJC2_9HEMI|nr:polymerase delta-interacting protein 3-like [Sipha flava]